MEYSAQYSCLNSTAVNSGEESAFLTAPFFLSFFFFSITAQDFYYFLRFTETDYKDDSNKFSVTWLVVGVTVGVVAVAAAVCAALMCRRRQHRSERPSVEDATIPSAVTTDVAYTGKAVTTQGLSVSTKPSASAGDKSESAGKVSEESTALEDSTVDSSIVED